MLVTVSLKDAVASIDMVEVAGYVGAAVRVKLLDREALPDTEALPELVERPVACSTRAREGWRPGEADTM